MTSRRSLAFVSFVLFLFVVGCASKPVPFTQELRNEYNLADAELKDLQYYVSKPITLQRQLSSGEHTVTGSHSLRSINKTQVEEVKIDSKTPGVAETSQDKSLRVSFEVGAFLWFGTGGADGGYYQLLADEWDRNSGKLNYGGRTFWAVERSSGAYLMVDLKRLSHFKKESHRAPGRKLN